MLIVREVDQRAVNPFNPAVPASWKYHSQVPAVKVQSVQVRLRDLFAHFTDLRNLILADLDRVSGLAIIPARPIDQLIEDR